MCTCARINLCTRKLPDILLSGGITAGEGVSRRSSTPVTSRGEAAGKIRRDRGGHPGYEGAARLYRDDYLVEDLYEDWTMIERERLSGAYVSILERLSDYYLDDSQLQNSADTCYRILRK